jgi:single-stranded-DNA-specific exonuclease
MARLPTLQMRDAPPRVVWALEQAGIHPLLARLFAGRGVRAADELDDGLGRLLAPDGLHGADAAARFLADAIGARKRLCIVADYDCDGATGRAPSRCAALPCSARRPRRCTTWCRIARCTATA